MNFIANAFKSIANMTWPYQTIANLQNTYCIFNTATAANASCDLYSEECIKNCWTRPGIHAPTHTTTTQTSVQHIANNWKLIQNVHTHTNGMNILPSCWLHCWTTAAKLARTFRPGLTGTGRDKKLGKVTAGYGWTHFCKQGIYWYALASLHGRARVLLRAWGRLTCRTRLAHRHPVQCWMPRHSEHLPSAGSSRGGLGQVSRLLFNSI